MSTDVVQVPYEDSESGEQVTGTLRFHNTSGTVSWQPADNDARIEGAVDHVLEAIDLLESPEQLRARFDALVEAGLEGEEPAGEFFWVNTGERCPDCSAGWLGMAEPTSVSPHDTVGPAVAAAWMRDVRRAEAGEDVRGLYGWGMRLCPRHRTYGRQRQT